MNAGLDRLAPFGTQPRQKRDLRRMGGTQRGLVPGVAGLEPGETRSEGLAGQPTDHGAGPVMLGADPGARNEPARVRVSLRAIAELKEVAEEEVARVVTDNTQRLLGPDRTC